MSSYTCLSCSVKFINADLQRIHYKTEWHRYNLKRKVVELPPVTEEEFSIKAELQTKKKENKLQEKSTSTICKLCNKSFLSENSFQNHVQSKKHQDLLSKSSSTDDVVEQHQKGNILKIKLSPIHYCVFVNIVNYKYIYIYLNIYFVT